MTYFGTEPTEKICIFLNSLLYMRECVGVYQLTRHKGNTVDFAIWGCFLGPKQWQHDEQKGPLRKAALTFPGSAGVGPGGSSEGPPYMETWSSFSFHALGTTGDQKSLVY